MNYQVIVGWFCRGIVIILTFINTRLLLDILGSQGFAAQSILVSMTGWFALFNLGLPMTVQNKISELRSRKIDRAYYVIESINVMFLQLMILLPFGIIAAYVVKLYILSAYPSPNLYTVFFYCLSLFILGQGQLLYQILYAEDLAVYPNSYPAVTSLCNTVVLLSALGLSCKDADIIIQLLACSNLVVFFHALIKCYRMSGFKFYIRLSLFLDSLKISYQNWIFAFFSTVTLAVDYIAMSQVLNSKDIVVYNLVSRLFGLVLILHGVMLSTNWSPLSELTQSGRYDEARSTVHRLLRNGFSIALLIGLLIVCFSNELLTLWIGDIPPEVDNKLLLSCFIYTLIRVWTDTFAISLLGSGKVKILNFYIPIQAALSFSLQYLLGKEFGVVGIYYGLIISFLVTASWILPFTFYKNKGVGS